MEMQPYVKQNLVFLSRNVTAQTQTPVFLYGKCNPIFKNHCFSYEKQPHNPGRLGGIEGDWWGGGLKNIWFLLQKMIYNVQKNVFLQNRRGTERFTCVFQAKMESDFQKALFFLQKRRG